jgi:hypothetical protein
MDHMIRTDEERNSSDSSEGEAGRQAIPEGAAPAAITNAPTEPSMMTRSKAAAASLPGTEYWLP